MATDGVQLPPATPGATHGFPSFFFFRQILYDDDFRRFRGPCRYHRPQRRILTGFRLPGMALGQLLSSLHNFERTYEQR
jgi:hypothetical protein